MELTNKARLDLIRNLAMRDLENTSIEDLRNYFLDKQMDFYYDQCDEDLVTHAVFGGMTLEDEIFRKED